jgi:hypothetical protein
MATMNPRAKAALMAAMARQQQGASPAAMPAMPGAGGMPPQGGGMPGMKKGGKVKRYDGGGDVDDGSDQASFAQPKGQSDDMSPADVKDMKDRKRATTAYDKANKTPSNPKKNYASGGSVSSASRRADGIAKKGFTKGTIC